MIERAKLKSAVDSLGATYPSAINDLAKRTPVARAAFSRQYNRKPIDRWTEEEKENTLGWMLGHNIIKG